MISRLLLITLLFFSHILLAQELQIIKAKKSYLKNGEKLKKDSQIEINSIVEIKRGGELSLKSRTGWHMFLEEGSYNINSAYESNLNLVKHDSIYSLMDNLGILNCDILSSFVCTPIMGGVRTSYAGMIEGRKNYSGKIIKSDSVILEWIDPSEIKQGYYFVVYNLFDELIGIHRTESNSITLNLVGYRKEIEGIMIYKIISDECKESRKAALNLK